MTKSLLLIVSLLLVIVVSGGTQTRNLKDAFKHSFLIGVAINQRQFSEKDTRGVAIITSQFNSISPENILKWQSVHPQPGKYDFDGSDRYVAFGEKHHMVIIGPTLVWHNQTPRWVFQDDKGNPVDREPLLGRMRDHIHTVVGRYKGRIKGWDVVNEAISDGGTNILRNSLWLEIIGPDFIAKAFEYAHEADPDAILRYNDYSLENPAKRRKLITLIKSLQDQGVPIHAIGSQAHLNVSASFDTMDQALTELATLGLPIDITELDVNSAAGGQRGFGADIANDAAATHGGLVRDADKKRADAYAGIFRAFVKHRDSVKMITFWGVNDAVSWRANGKPLLFDG